MHKIELYFGDRISCNIGKSTKNPQRFFFYVRAHLHVFIQRIVKKYTSNSKSAFTDSLPSPKLIGNFCSFVNKWEIYLVKTDAVIFISVGITDILIISPKNEII